MDFSLIRSTQSIFMHRWQCDLDHDHEDYTDDEILFNIIITVFMSTNFGFYNCYRQTNEESFIVMVMDQSWFAWNVFANDRYWVFETVFMNIKMLSKK